MKLIHKITMELGAVMLTSDGVLVYELPFSFSFSFFFRSFDAEVLSKGIMNGCGQ